MTFTQKDFDVLNDNQKDVLQRIHNASQSTDITVACRANANCPTRLAQRLYPEQKLNLADERVVAVKELVASKWIVFDNAKASHTSGDSIKYSVTPQYVQLSMASA